jgi:hypothetical protein
VRPSFRRGDTGRSRWAARAAGCALLAGVLSGCTAARSNLGTSDSSCYLALPTATKAIGSHGRLHGVQRFTLSVLRKKAPRLLHDLDTTAPGSETVCLVAFTGNFSAASVTDPRGRSSGKLAVVVSTTPGNHLLGTVIFTNAPLHFGHPHAG